MYNILNCLHLPTGRDPNLVACLALATGWDVDCVSDAATGRTIEAWCVRPDGTGFSGLGDDDGSPSPVPTEYAFGGGTIPESERIVPRVERMGVRDLVLALVAEAATGDDPKTGAEGPVGDPAAERMYLGMSRRLEGRSRALLARYAGIALEEGALPRLMEEALAAPAPSLAA